MLYQVIGNQFLVIKKTWPGLFIVFCGAIINLSCNYYLIPVLGIEGAGIATVIGYATSVCICSGVLIKMKLLEISNKFLFAAFLIIANILVWRIFVQTDIWLGLLLSLIMVILYLYIYRKNIVENFSKYYENNFK